MNITLDHVKTIGSGLLRPEGVMSLDDGGLYTADARGRCSRIGADGKTSFFGELGGLPNGICVDERGNCIVANIGNGEVESLSPSGESVVLMTEAEGKRMYTPNFPFIDFKGRLWISNSTDNSDVDASLQEPVPDGCLVMTEWPEFSQLDKEFDLMAHRVIIEGRRILTCKGADGICW